MPKSITIWIIFSFLLSVFLYNTSFAASNKYLTSNTYKIINVTKGDSLWSISSKYVTDKEDIRQLIAAVRQLNQLDHNAQIHPGQSLKIPISTDH